MSVLVISPVALSMVNSASPATVYVPPGYSSTKRSKSVPEELGVGAGIVISKPSTVVAVISVILSVLPVAVMRI